MTLNFKEPEDRELRARIVVFGVGGAGGNAVNNMIDKNLPGVDFVAANTDNQALQNSKATHKVQLGANVTGGLGAGSNAEVGHKAAEESIKDITSCLDGAHMCFITAGMGGGTGTGAAPVVANAARELGILTVGVVTKPFQFEGERRMKLAEVGVGEIQKVVDTLIVIPNQNLFHIASEKTTFVEAFEMADDVLYQGVQGVTDLMVRPGMINLDFADVRSVMGEMGKAMMGTGEAEGEGRASEATEKAIANPLLDEVNLRGAKGVLINITGGYDLTLFEMDEASNRIKNEVDKEALIKFGSSIDPEMEGKMRVSVVATGIDAESMGGAQGYTPNRHRPLETDQDLVTAVRNARAAQTATPENEAEDAHTSPNSEEETETGTPDDSEPHDRAEETHHEQTEGEETNWQQPEDDIEPALFDIDTESLADSDSSNERPALAARNISDTSQQTERPDLPPRNANAFTPDVSLEQPEESAEEPARQGFFAIKNLISRVAGVPQQDKQVLEHQGEASEADESEGDIPAFLRRQAN